MWGGRCRAGLREQLHRDLYAAAGNGTGVLVTEMQEKDAGLRKREAFLHGEPGLLCLVFVRL